MSWKDWYRRSAGPPEPASHLPGESRRFRRGGGPLLAFLIAVVVASTVSAAGPPADDDPEGDGAGGQGPTPPEEVHEALHVILIFELKREVGLSDEEILRVVPLVEESTAARRRFHQEQRRVSRLLGDEARKEAPDAAQLERLIAEARQLTRDFNRGQEQLLDEMLAPLSPLQRAKLMVLLEGFERRVRRYLGRMRGCRSGGPPRGPRGGMRAPRAQWSPF